MAHTVFDSYTNALNRNNFFKCTPKGTLTANIRASRPQYPKRDQNRLFTPPRETTI